MCPFLASCGDQINSRAKLAGIGPALLATAVTGSLLLLPSWAAARSSATALACRASVSDRFPSEDSAEIIDVATVAHAHVATSAHYESTTDTMVAKANRHGHASTRYDVSDATRRYKVIVTVKVESGDRSGYCRTSYTPE